MKLFTTRLVALAAIITSILLFGVRPSWAGITQICTPVSGAFHAQTFFLQSTSGCTYQVGDVMIAALTVSSANYNIVVAPSAWHNADNLEDTNSPPWQYRLFYHIVTGTEPSYYTWGFSGYSVDVAFSSVTYRGANTSLPLFFDAGYGNSGRSSSLMIGQSISPTFPDDDMIAIFASPGKTGFSNSPPPMTMDANLSSGTTQSDQNLWYAEENVMPPGPTGTLEATQSGHNDWIAYTYALAAASPNAFYMSSSTGTDSFNCGYTPQTACKTIGYLVSQEYRINPNCMIMFRGGDVWNEKLTLNTVNGQPGSPDVFGSALDGSFGSGRPVIDGNGTIDSCVSANQANSGEGNVSYVTIEGFECRNTTQYGINFNVEGNPPQRGIVVNNNYIHNTGPFVTINGTVYPCDDLKYRNQLNAEDNSANNGLDSSGGDGFVLMNNTVNNCGGHNCVEIHYDTGWTDTNGVVHSPTIYHNVVGAVASPGGPVSSCNHNCIDVKGVVGAQIMRNTATCPNCLNYVVPDQPGATCAMIQSTSGPAGFYVENQWPAYTSTLTWENNIAFNIPIGFQVETAPPPPPATGGGPINASIWNNTTFGTPTPGGWDIISSNDLGPLAIVTLDVEKNLLDGDPHGATTDIKSSDHVITWSYNDDVNTTGAPSSGTTIDIEPAFSAGTYQPTNPTVLMKGQSDTVTPYPYLGACDSTSNQASCP